MIQSPQLSHEEIESMVAHLQKLFKQVAPLILENAGKIGYSSKTDGSPVTIIDETVEKILLDSFKKEFPKVPIFGEESGYDSKLPDICWLVDPIDGTKSFIENIPSFTCMAVLIVDEEAVASIIYNPSSDEMFTAIKDEGAYKNNEKLDLKKKSLNPVVFCKGRHIESLTTLLKPANIVCEVAPEGAGHGFAMVAEGNAAARFQLHSRGFIHDYATGALLVNEAGGVIIPILEDAYTYKSKSFVACHPKMENIVREQLENIRSLENNG